jgi:ATP-dependent Clp protease ATP-binding subunit ClpB
MNFEKFTDRTKGFVQAAQGIAIRENHQRFTAEHLAKALFDDPEGLAIRLVEAAGANVTNLQADIAAELAKLPQVEGAGAGQLHLDPPVARIFESAEQIAKKAGDSFVTSERLLQAIAMSPDTAS